MMPAPSAGCVPATGPAATARSSTSELLSASGPEPSAASAARDANRATFSVSTVIGFVEHLRDDWQVALRLVRPHSGLENMRNRSGGGRTGRAPARRVAHTRVAGDRPRPVLGQDPEMMPAPSAGCVPATGPAATARSSTSELLSASGPEPSAASAARDANRATFSVSTVIGFVEHLRDDWQVALRLVRPHSGLENMRNRSGGGGTVEEARFPFAVDRASAAHRLHRHLLSRY